MKKCITILSFVFIFLIGLSVGQQQTEATAQVIFKVTDDTGEPIFGAKIYFAGIDATGSTSSKETNTLGEVTFSANSNYGIFVFDAEKDKYYKRPQSPSANDSTRLRINFDEEPVNGRWQPWNKVVEIRLYRILNPIPLCARDAGEDKPLRLPALDKPVGFDLEISDWVAPYGQGKVSDLIFQLDGATQDTQKPYQSSMTVTFSNPQDGIILVPKKDLQHSALQLPYQAPENGYLEKYVMTEVLRVKKDPSDIADLRLSSTHPGDSYFLRLRTKTDNFVKIISANYAKIYGGINNEGLLWSPNGKLKFKYYYNPKPNDRNLEYSGKNLLDFTTMPWIKQPKREGVGQP